MRTGQYIYVEYADDSREFYDLARDALEFDNLAGRLPATTLAALHNDLLALKNCHGMKACAAADHPAPPPGLSTSG